MLIKRCVKRMLACKQKLNGETMIDVEKFVGAMKLAEMPRQGLGYVGLLEWKVG